MAGGVTQNIRSARQLREARLEVVAELYKRGYSYRKIRTETMARMNLPAYSLSTVKTDVGILLKEWRESRLSDMDAALTLELARIDETIQELWSQWERSKTDYQQRISKMKGTPNRNQDGVEQSGIRTHSIEETKTDKIMLGDVSYISEIRAQLAERRKLLGLYAPEKKDISGDLSFTSFLIESGIIDEIDTGE